MRLIAVASTIFTLALMLVLSVGHSADAVADQNDPNVREGQHIFRYDTFGDEQLWTDVLRMHEVVETVSPATGIRGRSESRYRRFARRRDRCVESGTGKSERPSRDDRLAAAQLGRRRYGKSWGFGAVGKCGHHMRALPLVSG